MRRGCVVEKGEGPRLNLLACGFVEDEDFPRTEDGAC